MTTAAGKASWWLPAPAVLEKFLTVATIAVMFLGWLLVPAQRSLTGNWLLVHYGVLAPVAMPLVLTDDIAAGIPGPAGEASRNDGAHRPRTGPRTEPARTPVTVPRAITRGVLQLMSGDPGHPHSCSRRADDRSGLIRAWPR